LGAALAGRDDAVNKEAAVDRDLGTMLREIARVSVNQQLRREDAANHAEEAAATPASAKTTSTGAVWRRIADRAKLAA
jgi:hypothetical protein